MFKGAYAALFTAIDDNDEVSEKWMRAHVEWLIEKGINGLYINGNTGQGVFLSVDERKKIADIVMDQAAGRVTIINHICAMATKDAVALVKHSNEIGVDAIASLPPIYWAYRDEEVLQYFKDINADSSLPCFVYHRPGGGTVEVSLDCMLKVVDIENVCGVKWTSPNFFQLQLFRQMAKKEITAFSGPDELFLPALTMGVVGSVGTTHNVFPELFVDIYEKFHAGDIAGAMATQEKVTRIVGMYGKYGVTTMAKSMLRARGVETGICRPPIRKYLPDGEDAKVAEELRKIVPELM